MSTEPKLPPLPSCLLGLPRFAEARAWGLQCFEAGRQHGRVNSAGLERELFLVLSDPDTSLSDGAMRTIHHVCNQLHAASTTELPKA